MLCSSLTLALFIREQYKHLSVVQSHIHNTVTCLVPQQPALCHGIVSGVLSEPLFLLDHLLEVVVSIIDCRAVLLLC